jgi:DNA-binding CsgD family transcriptional regulator
MPCDPLTEKQAEVLPLVRDGLTTKEIARRLNISPHTVDQRIDAARRKLGASTRAEAARVYASQFQIPQKTIYEPIPLTRDDRDAASPPLPRGDLRFEDAMFDERAAWDRGTLWRRPHFAPRDMGKASRLLAILALAVLMLLTAGEGVRFARSLGLIFSS